MQIASRLIAVPRDANVASYFIHIDFATAVELLLSQRAEESLDQIQPRRAGQRKVLEYALLALDPVHDLGGLVGRVIVQDDVILLVYGHGFLQLTKEFEHLLVTVTHIRAADHLAGGHLQGREKTCSAVPLVVVRLGSASAAARNGRATRPGQTPAATAIRPRLGNTGP